MKKKVFLAAVSVLCAISLYNALMHWRGYVGQIRQTSAKAMSLAETETAGAALRVEKELGGLKPVVEALAGALGAGQVRLDGVSGRLREIVAENPGVYGAGVASIPHIHDPDYRRSSPYYVRGSSGRAGEALQLFAAPFYFV
ncbi:MAG TPA: hypothetical protein VGB23_01530, partial [Nitrospirota bacterium]